jgi:hypothetical protein
MSSRIAVRRKRRRAEVTMGGRIAVALGCLLFSVAGVSAKPAFVEAARLQGLRGVDPREVVLFPAAGSAWVAFAAGGAVHARRIPGQGTTPGAPVADLTEPAVWTSDRPDGTVRLLGAYGTAGRSPWLCFVEDHPGGSTLWLAPRPYVRRGRPGAYAVDRDDVTGRIDAYWVYQESQGRATIVYLREGALHGVLVSADGRVHGASSLSVAEEAVLHLELVTTVGGESVRHEGFYTAGLRDGGFVTRAILLEGGAVVAGEVVAQGVRMPQVRLASFTPVRRGLLVQTDRSLRRFWWAGTVLRGAGTRELPRAATAITASDGTAGAAVVAAGEDRVWLLSDRGIAAEIPGSLAAGPAWTVPAVSPRDRRGPSRARESGWWFPGVLPAVDFWYCRICGWRSPPKPDCGKVPTSMSRRRDSSVVNAAYGLWAWERRAASTGSFGATWAGPVGRAVPRWHASRGRALRAARESSFSGPPQPGDASSRR